MQIRIQAFAALRDHFGAEFVLEVEPGLSAGEVLERLADLRPAARELLSASRLALGEDLVQNDYAPTETEWIAGEICLLPPASGG